jgi:hypothetical protein
MDGAFSLPFNRAFLCLLSSAFGDLEFSLFVLYKISEGNRQARRRRRRASRKRNERKKRRNIFLRKREDNNITKKKEEEGEYIHSGCPFIAGMQLLSCKPRDLRWPNAGEIPGMIAKNEGIILRMCHDHFHCSSIHTYTF